MKVYVKLYELKKGDLFYDHYDNLIYIFVTCKYDEKDPNNIQYRRKLYKYRNPNGLVIPETINISGENVANREYMRFTHRDKGSFIAGFKMAIELCSEHMGKFDLENAGLDNPVRTHMTMLEKYKEWKVNIKELF